MNCFSFGVCRSDRGLFAVGKDPSGVGIGLEGTIVPQVAGLPPLGRSVGDSCIDSPRRVVGGPGPGVVG